MVFGWFRKERPQAKLEHFCSNLSPERIASVSASGRFDDDESPLGVPAAMFFLYDAHGFLAKLKEQRGVDRDYLKSTNHDIVIFETAVATAKFFQHRVDQLVLDGTLDEELEDELERLSIASIQDMLSILESCETFPSVREHCRPRLRLYDDDIEAWPGALAAAISAGRGRSEPWPDNDFPRADFLD